MKMINKSIFSSENKYIQNKSNNYYLKVFSYGLITSFLIFIPFIINDKGYFIYYGDYNAQEIPFYQLAHDAIRNGNFFWDFKTDLGANFIGSYSFYMLGSPFFLLTLPFPNHVVPYLMGPLLILKFACASLTSFVYLKRYVKNKDLAVLGAILYSFSGFSIYNIFFNHFHEPIIVFPLLLYACDEFMYKKRRGIFAFCTFLSCTINYYFFVNQVVFTTIYWLVRFISKSWRINIKQFLYLIFESILGVMMSSILLFPSCLAVVQNYRTNNFPKGFSALLYNYEQRYLHIITSLFFPPDIPARPNFTPGSEAKWASVAAWLPFFGMSGVIAFIRSKKSWIKSLLIILFFMSMVPILNSAFQFFNATFYTRWFYTLTLLMSLATIQSIEKKNINLKNGLYWSLGITVTISLLIGLMPNGKGIIGLMTYPDRFWTYVFISIFGSITLIIILKYSDNNKKELIKWMTCFTCLFSVATSIYMISLGKSCSYNVKDFIIPHCLNQTEPFSLTEVESSRVDVYEGMDNQAMFFKMNTIQAFHSIVPGSIMDFYPTIGVKRDVASRPKAKYYGLRSFTSCKYLLCYEKNKKKFNSTIMPGWSYLENQNGFEIWNNDYYIPFGFTYDKYMDKLYYDSVNESDRHLVLLKAILLEDDCIKQNSDILEDCSGSSFSFSEDEYFSDCINRKNLCCTNFNIDRYGFSAEIDVPSGKDELVFFSVPYENGFRAQVNSNEVKIEKANVGFMAIRVPSGQKSTIRFNYMTPGLTEGIVLTSISFFIYLTYFIIIKRDKQNKFRKRVTYKIKVLSSK